MSIWALADLHLSFGVADKGMEVFGENWRDHPEKIRQQWLTLIKPEDLVLLAGDISWAMRPEEARADLEWIHALPGTKVLIRGNHDYWWTSLSKVEKVLPSSIHLIQNNAYFWNGIAIAGARLWDTPEYSFSQFIEYRDNPRANHLIKVDNAEEAEKIFQRELGRLEMSLKAMNKQATKRIVMTHYPPIGADLKESRTSQMLEKYHVDCCVFGHLHNVRKDALPFGTKAGVNYVLTSCDYVEFCPIQIL